MKPVIGVVSSCSLEKGSYVYHVLENNIKAIADSGGLPVILPYTQAEADMKQYLSLVSGLYYIGGCDILPDYYGEAALPALGELCPPRDIFEISLYQLAARLDLPMLGVCRGMQVMNVAAGGSLYQDLYSQMPQANLHDPKNLERSLPFHSIQIQKDTRLFELLGNEILKVNSTHHEAVKDVAPGYRAVGFASDQVIEAIESTELTFSLGVQWHPEDMYRQYPLFSRLYEAFVAAASAYRNQHEGF
jgi:putative glutamine amidotransferase